jgi:hypothetical protein
VLRYYSQLKWGLAEPVMWPETGQQKKGAAVSGGSKVNREASNRVDRSHSMSRSMDNMTNGRESLTSYEDF